MVAMPCEFRLPAARRSGEPEGHAPADGEDLGAPAEPRRSARTSPAWRWNRPTGRTRGNVTASPPQGLTEGGPVPEPGKRGSGSAQEPVASRCWRREKSREWRRSPNQASPTAATWRRARPQKPLKPGWRRSAISLSRRRCPPMPRTGLTCSRHSAGSWHSPDSRSWPSRRRKGFRDVREKLRIASEKPLRSRVPVRRRACMAPEARRKTPERGMRTVLKGGGESRGMRRREPSRADSIVRGGQPWPSGSAGQCAPAHLMVTAREFRGRPGSIDGERAA